MKREDVMIIRDTENGSYAAIPAKKVVKGYLHDTYNNWGQTLFPEEAGDYTFGEETFDRDLEKVLREKFEFLSDAVFYFNADGIFDYDCELTENEEKQINEFISKFHDENYIAVEATYFNYWDGSNWKSIIFECEGYWNVYEIVDDQELADEIYEDFENAKAGKESNGFTDYEGPKYTHTTSRWANNPFFFESEEK